jgi:hypothetical protein
MASLHACACCKVFRVASNHQPPTALRCASTHELWYASKQVRAYRCDGEIRWALAILQLKYSTDDVASTLVHKDVTDLHHSLTSTHASAHAT